jgi:diguanylate cyclase (GGDEF)-like protein
MWTGALEGLREHPIFDVPDPDRSRLKTLGEPDGATTARDPEREAQFIQETMQLFRRRTNLITVAAIVALPPYGFLFGHFAPHALSSIAILHTLLVLFCATANYMARRTHTLNGARLWATTVYAGFGLTGAAVMIAADDPRVNAFAGHVQIMMSLLYMPFSARDAAKCACITAISYAIGLAATQSGDGLDPVYWPHVASIVVTGVIVVFMAWLQSGVRRQAFDSAFDMARLAARGAVLSSLDAVTGGHNRRHLLNSLELELARATRFQQPMALLMFDLDNFKAVNDNLGHSAGDDLLREIMAASTAALRGIDIVGRYGGDEFGAILPGTAHKAAIQTGERLSEAVRERLQRRFGADSLQAQVTLSMGIACYNPPETVDVDTLIDRADERMYEAKRGGKNRIVCESKEG